MRANHNDYEIDDDAARLDLGRLHGWLASTYWSPGVSLELVERAARGSSLVVGAYVSSPRVDDGVQVGYLRVVSDRATFAWICDVFVDESHRGKGLARAMVRFALAHPEHQSLRRWLLATRDAHDVYRALGFEPLTNAQRWMAFHPNPRHIV
jgi:GNAT superfamily N-acetyltransferase